MPGRVMIIDDEPSVRLVMKRFLTQEGCEVSPHATLAEALRKLAEWTPQLILLDYFLPENDGLESLRALKAASPGAPVVVITGWSEGETTRRTLEAGAVEVLYKPIKWDRLREILKPLKS